MARAPGNGRSERPGTAAAGRPATDGARSRFGRLPYPLRTVLRHARGIVGMVVGVGLALGIAMALLGVNAATTDLFTREYRASGADLRVITRGGTLVPLLPSDSPGTIRHATNILAQIRGLPGVTEAVGVLGAELTRERPGPRRTDLPDEQVAVLGIDGDPAAIPGAVTLDAGRWVQRSDELVVGPRLSREKRLRLGDTLRLNGRDFRIVGIGRLHGFGYREDSLAYLDRDSLRQRTPVGDLVSAIVVDTARPDLARARIPELDSLAVYDVAETVRLAEEAQAADRTAHWIIALMTLAIAALFVSNMLGGAVEARRAEFATLRAIGMPGHTIMLTVVAEAVAVCLAAWVVGVALSTLLGALINAYVAPEYGEESLYLADAGLFLTVFVLALALGIVAGVGPARLALNVDPVEVLREA